MSYIEIPTVENTRVFIKAGSLKAYEIVPATARTPLQIKIYIEGFSFLVKMELDEFLRLIDSDRQ